VNQPFKKVERLSRYSLIRKLFAEGSSFHLSPFRVTWLRMESDFSQHAQVMLSVPKHNIREAATRNLVRRRMRESYRLNKQILYEPLVKKQQKLLLCFTFTAKEILSFAEIQVKIILLLQRLIKENEKLTR